MCEIAWAAGFFDGEGHTWGRPGSIRCGIVIAQVHRETLERFRLAVGVGTVTGPRKPGGDRWGPRQPVYEYHATNFNDVQVVIAAMWKFLSPPKRDQARAVLQTVVVQHRRRVAAGAGRTGAIPTGRCSRCGRCRAPRTRCKPCNRDRMREAWASGWRPPSKRRQEQER